MDILLVVLEVSVLTTLFVGLHASRRWLGPSPLILGTGVVLVFMSIGFRLQAEIAMFRGAAPYSLVHLSLVLGTMAMVYALEGTAAARRFIVSVGLAGLVLLLMRVLLAQHLLLDGNGLEQWGRAEWLVGGGSAYRALVSSAVLVLDGAAIVIAYQAASNVFPRFPLALPLALALVAGMITDGMLYGLLTFKFSLGNVIGHIEGKALAGAAAAIPLGAYFHLSLRSSSEEVRDGVLHRNTFALFDLRSQLGSVHRALEESKAENEVIKQIFSRYVTADIVEELLTDPNGLHLGGEQKEVSVLFSDIRGYSALSEQMSPPEIIHLLNRYFGAMSEIIRDERGTVIEFEGDAILAVWGAPLDMTDHADRAVRSAVRMLERVEELNREWASDGTSRLWQDAGFEDFRIRIGLHTGPVVAGNIGSEYRTKYAIIGDTVNTTSRVEGLNKVLRTSLLLTQATVDALEETRLPLHDLGEHTVKGKRAGVRVFTLRGLRADIDETATFL